MNAHIQQAGLLSGRHMTLLVVIGLHALIITALIAIKIAPPLMDPGPTRITVIDPIDPNKPLPPPEPKLEVRQIETLVPVVLPLIPVNIVPSEETIPVAEDQTAAVTSDTGIAAVVGTPAGTGVTVPTHVSTGLQYRMTRSTDEYYPDASIRAEEQGVAIVRVCVDAAGRIQGAPTIEATSGYKRLDQAAIRWARESLRFTPATEDGVAVAACKGFRVNFDLR